MTESGKPAHSFHIPVMGTGFTIDTPLKVARFGISSVISLVDDVLIEQMRKFHCQENAQPYEAISAEEKDSRALRITAYLNLLDRLVKKQAAALQSSEFEKGSEITRYYEMLPPGTNRFKLYAEMLNTTDSEKKAHLQIKLRELAAPGSIDVNIMTKPDCDRYYKGEKLPDEYTDASSALRGYANSTLNSSIVLSAGFNPRLYNYISSFNDFLPDENGQLKKRVILKVSDYRSAMIQGKYLAKHGIWVSEYRIESALNCGGHAFGSEGYLMGPILEEFKENRQNLIETLHKLYSRILKDKNGICVSQPHETCITVQGGVGTHDEHKFLLEKYHLDAVGWGTPFMLVPDVINIDDKHLRKLAAATENDVFLSESSPLGVPFWNLSTSASEEARRKRIKIGCPGSACLKRFAKMNTEFTKKPLCIASRAYQKLKLLHLPEEGWTAKQLQIIKEKILSKSCICHDLAGCVTKKLGIDPKATTSLCPGPNIVNFSKIAGLEEMVGHIYGRISLLTQTNRPHLFLKELKLYIDFLKAEIEKSAQGLASRTQDKFQKIKENLMKGIDYYQELAKDFISDQQESFIKYLNFLKESLEKVPITV